MENKIEKKIPDVIKLSAPWYTFYKKINALFELDPEVNVDFDDAKMIIKVYVGNAEKAEALYKLLPQQRMFGDVVVKVNVIPANKLKDSAYSIASNAFRGNPAVDDVLKIDTYYGQMCYVQFAKDVVQFYNDDLSDPRGLCSTLYQDIAKDVFETPNNLFYCTAPKEDLDDEEV